MESTMICEKIVYPSDCDREGRLSVPDLFAWFMDIATLHAQSLGVGIDSMGERGLFWITVKTKVRILRRPRMLESVRLFTRILPPERIRSIREYQLEQDGNLLAQGKTEWAAIETDSGRLRPMAGIFPAELEPEAAPAFSEPFARIHPDFSDAELLGQYTVRSTDIDMGGHMNNIAYLRAIWGLLSTQEAERFPQSGVEISFRSPCFEGDVLTIRRRISGSGWELAAFLPDEKPAVFVKAD